MIPPAAVGCKSLLGSGWQWPLSYPLRILDLGGNELTCHAPQDGNRSLTGRDVIIAIDVKNVLRWIQMRNCVSDQRPEVVDHDRQLAAKERPKHLPHQLIRYDPDPIWWTV